jgi:hypothetical protein
MLNEIMLQKNSEIIETIIKWRSMTTENLKALAADSETGHALGRG